MRILDEGEIQEFQAAVWVVAAERRRVMPWREAEVDGGFDPYKILVSEVMLQQTQVARVVPKFEEFVGRFPSLQILVAAPLGEVLRAWQGLGYNRRAKFLWQAAQKIVADFGSTFPDTAEALESLPGVGPNTAGAVLAYAFNQPAVFVETNIRTVFIHHFFAGQTAVPDKEILDLVAQTLPVSAAKTTGSPDVRGWYWALMDYGNYLKQTAGNLASASKQYVKQPRFAGSRRQLRGQVIRLLADSEQTLAQLKTQIADERLSAVLADLSAENLIRRTTGRYRLA